jgi:hypothetical protein
MLDSENWFLTLCIFYAFQKQRLDTQLKYLQTNFDELEQTERRLIKEKREAQREVIIRFYSYVLNSFSDLEIFEFNSNNKNVY